VSDPVPTALVVPLPRFASSIGQRSDLIYKTEWSQVLSWGDTLRFAEYVDAFEAKEGVEIFRQGQLGHYLCLLVGGRVGIIKEDSSGERKTLATIGPGKTFGEMSLVDGEPRSAYAIALDDSKVLVLTEENFKRLVDQHPRLGATVLMKLCNLMSQRLRRTSIMLVDFLGD
jgi:CRP-like cAMP-binding protein